MPAGRAGTMAKPASGTAFSPLDLSPALWLDASNAGSITSSAGAVSQWDDLSGNTKHVTQATAGQKPTTASTTQNGLNVLAFDGGDRLIAAAAADWKFMHDGTLHLIGAVWNPGSSGSRALLGTNANPTAGEGARVLAVAGPTLRHAASNLTASTILNNAASNIVFSAANVTTILADPSNGTAVNRSSIYLNAGAASKGNSLTATASASNPIQPLNIGANPEAGSGFNFCTGWIAEVVIVSGANATVPNQVLLRDYLNAKWAVY